METDGGKGCGSFQKVIPDICILDIMLPNKDGFEIAEDIRHVDTSVPLIFLTAKTQTEDVVKGFKLGGNDYNASPSVWKIDCAYPTCPETKTSEENGMQGDACSWGGFSFMSTGSR
jgi:PleD family two-component response regulator